VNDSLRALAGNGRFDKALDEALAKGWTVVSMKDDWKIIYVGDKKIKKKRRTGRIIRTAANQQ